MSRLGSKALRWCLLGTILTSAGCGAAGNYMIVKALDEASAEAARVHSTHQAVTMTVSRGSPRGVMAEVRYECGRTAHKFLGWPKRYRSRRIRYDGEHVSRDETPARLPRRGEVVFGHLADAPRLDILSRTKSGGWLWRPLGGPLKEKVRMGYLH